MRAKKPLILLGFVGFIYVFIGTGLAVAPLLAWWQQAYRLPLAIDWHKPTTLLLLTGGEVRLPGRQEYQPGTFAYGRLLKTAQLYQACVKAQGDCRILISGGDPRQLGQSEAHTYQSALQALAIPAAAIQLEPYSPTTFEQARLLSQTWRQSPRQMVLITSAYHLKRAVYLFTLFDVPVIPMASDYLVSPYSLKPSAYNLMLMDIMAHETVGWVAVRLLGHQYERMWST